MKPEDKMDMNLRKTGASPVISTLLLTAVILVLVISTSIYAMNRIDYEKAKAEYDYMKECFAKMASYADSVLFSEGATISYPLIISRGLLNVVNDTMLRLTITLDGNIVFDATFDTANLTYIAPGVTYVGTEYLYGNFTRRVIGTDEYLPIPASYTAYVEGLGPIISLDFRRAKVTSFGRMNIEGTYYNYIVVLVVESYAKVLSPRPSSIMFACRGVRTYDPIVGYGSITVTVTCHGSEYITLPTDYYIVVIQACTLHLEAR